jgi:hypothetical protein
MRRKTMTVLVLNQLVVLHLAVDEVLQPDRTLKVSLRNMVNNTGCSKKTSDKL